MKVSNLCGIAVALATFGLAPASLWANPAATAPAKSAATLSATRVEGPAPLAVLFDATASGPLDGVYSFDFGDADAGTWAVSGQPKNTQRGGALAAHVFDRPGTYTVRASDASVTITVQDPNVVFRGRRTLCVSTRGDYEGCPEGASKTKDLPTSYAGRRVLLRRGESFPAVAPQASDHGFQVGAFGIGPKPQVTGVTTSPPGPDGGAPRDWTVMDLDIGNGTVSIEATTSRFLLYRNDITRHGGTDSMINIGTAVTWYAKHGHPKMQWPREIFLVENTVQGVVAERKTSPNITVMGWFWKSAILGNTMDRAYEHTLRIWAAGRTVIAHNAIGGTHRPEPNGVGIRHALKLHSSGQQPFTDAVASSPEPATSQIVVANNRFGTPAYPGSWLVALAPQNTDAVEGLEDLVVENNTFVRGPKTSADLALRGRRITHRGNRAGPTPASIMRIRANFPAGSEPWDGPYHAK